MIGIRKQRGFTLIELVIVITILGVISVVIGRVLLQGYDTMLTSEQVSSTGSQGLIALENLRMMCIAFAPKLISPRLLQPS
jgi:prepilin-type N-terminal cleavage/methylation domain-containing protein